MRKRYYFTFKKGNGKSSVTLFLKLQNGKFCITHQLHSQYLFNWFQAYWYWIKFNLPSWIKKNGSMFKYAETTGIVNLQRLENEMLN